MEKILKIGVVCLIVSLVLTPSITACVNSNTFSLKEQPTLSEESKLIMCTNRLFFFSKIYSNGLANYVKEKTLLGVKKLTIMYFDEDGDWDYGFAHINRILLEKDFGYVIGISIYGFQGTTSWSGDVEDTDIWFDGYAPIIVVSYHGKPSKSM